MLRDRQIIVCTFNHTSISRLDVIGVTMPKFDPSVHHLDSIVQNYYKLVNILITNY